MARDYIEIEDVPKGYEGYGEGYWTDEEGAMAKVFDGISPNAKFYVKKTYYNHYKEVFEEQGWYLDTMQIIAR